MFALQTLPNTFTTKTALKSGVHPSTLYRWREDGEIIELSRGVFRQTDAPLPTYPDFLAAAYRSPKAIVCCLAAAAVYDLTDEIPRTVQIAVMAQQRPPRISYPPTETFRFNKATFELGLSSIEAAPGEYVRIYDSTRTVIDLMRMRHRLGEPLAHIALRRYLRERGAQPAHSLKFAAALDVYGPIRTALEVLTAQ